MSSLSAGKAKHPLDPLSAEEIQIFTQLLNEKELIKESSRLGYLMLREPDKKNVLAFRYGEQFIREVSATIYDLIDHDLKYVCVDINTGDVVEVREVDLIAEGMSPYMLEEMMSSMEVTYADPDFIKAIERRGITEMERVRLIPLSGGRFGYQDEIGIRVTRVTPYLAPNAEFGTMAGCWGQPIEGIRVDIDATNGRVLRVIDNGVYPIPQESGEIHTQEALGTLREGLKPIVITQPEGVSFNIEGNEMSWQNWNFRIGYNAREGLTIHQVSYKDKEKVRPVLYRASVAEMVVNYGDTSASRNWINYFDAGEYQFGRFANSLKLGCDCLGEIVYKDVTFADDFGNPVTVQNGICIHEEDYGVLWKHTDPFNTEIGDVRRQRRLVVSCFLTAGNYDYGFYWHFYLDGKIELEVKANGLVVTAGSRDDDEHPSVKIAPDLGGTPHQHLFCLRLDTMVDGVLNHVDEYEVERIHDDQTQPIWGGAFTQKVTRLKTEVQAQRMAATDQGRIWKIASGETTNRIGKAPAYVIHSAGGPLLLSHPDAPIAKRAKFATKSLWVTKYRRDENWPAGYMVNQSSGSDGVAKYAARNESVDDEDIVVWHTFGLTHFPRSEDWPVMPVDYATVTLSPSGFFERNPTLDVPETKSLSCHSAESKSHCNHK